MFRKFAVCVLIAVAATAFIVIVCAPWMAAADAALLPLPAHVSPPPNTMPDLALTPGVERSPQMTVAQLCATKWGEDHRAVTEAMKAAVYRSYGFSGTKDPRCIPDHPGSPTAKTCEIDHLLSRENGGADDVRNLWPEPYGGAWNAHDKDRLENALHADMCAGRKTLEQVHSALRGWQDAYVAEFRALPASAGGAR